MNNSAVILEEREKGQFPLSIPTSLALEGVFGILEDKPNPKIPPIEEYGSIWFNLRTLFRNANGSIKKEDEVNLSPNDYANLIREEMSIIRGIVGQRTNHRVMVHFYVCTYKNLLGIYKHCQIREVRTEKQKHYFALENKTIELLVNLLKELGDSVHVFDTTLDGDKSKALIATHLPLDLLSNKNFSNIALLESHSGSVKTKALWHTKLHNGKDLIRIPFDIMTIQLFGDSGNMFAPYPQEFRKAILEIAEKNKWTSTTTKDRIKLTVKLARQPTLEATVMKLYGIG